MLLVNMTLFCNYVLHLILNIAFQRIFLNLLLRIVPPLSYMVALQVFGIYAVVLFLLLDNLGCPRKPLNLQT